MAKMRVCLFCGRPVHRLSRCSQFFVVIYPSMQRGFVPLHTAAFAGHVDIIVSLLATPGVNPLARSPVSFAQIDFISSRTPLPSVAEWVYPADMCTVGASCRCS